MLGALFLGLIALALRVWGVGWSLPYVDHPDEPAVMNVVLRIVAGQLDPHFFFYPSLMLYAQTLLLKLHFAWGLANGSYHTPLTLPTTTDFITTIPQAFIVTRLLTAVLGATTVVVLAFGGARLLNRRAALLGAALLALSPWAITHAHFMTVDVPAALGSTCAILGAIFVLERGTWRAYLLAGLAVGLATATKYQNALLCVPLLLAHLLHWRRQALATGARLIIAGAVAGLVFIATSPYILLDWPAFSRDLGTLFGSYNGQHGDITGRWPVLAYLHFLWSQALGSLGSLLVLIGTLVLLRCKPAHAAVVLAFPVVLLLTLLRVQTHFFRNLLPLQPPLLLLAGYGAIQLWDVYALRLPRQLRPGLALACIAGLLLPPGIAAFSESAKFAQPDARVIAQTWSSRIWPATRIAAELQHPLAIGGVTQATTFLNLAAHGFPWYRAQGYGLLLLTSDARHSWELTAPYQQLLATGKQAGNWGGPGSGYRGPRIDLIDTGLTTATLSAQPVGATIGPLRLDAVLFGRRLVGPAGPEVAAGEAVKRGGVLGITAFWQRLIPVVPAAQYITFIQLRDAANHTVAQRDTPPWAGLFPVSSWPLGTVVEEALDLPMPATLGAGTYHLVLGMYDRTTGARLDTRQAAASLTQNEIDLGTVVVVR